MSERERVILTGATGTIGRRLFDRLRERSYDVIVFSRSAARARQSLPGAADYVDWDAGESGPWASAIDGAHAVINLAGASISQRWTASHKRAIRDSRVIGTRGLVGAIRQASRRPAVLVNGSATGYYGDRGAEQLTEESPPGDDFLARVCREWEDAARQAEELGVRVARVRTGIVLDTDGGALPLMSLPFKLFVGGPILPGTQYLSWIHRDDEVGLLLLALEDERVSGALNATAPNPQTNREFSRTLASVLSRPSLIPVPGFALKLAMGEMAEALLIQGQRVLPARAQALGYQFKHPTSAAALHDLY